MYFLRALPFVVIALSAPIKLTDLPSWSTSTNECDTYDDIELFNGSWQIDNAYSDSLGSIMQVMGYGRIAVNVVNNFKAVTEMSVNTTGSFDTIDQISYLPRDKVSSGQWILNGTRSTSTDATTGITWINVRSGFKNGVLYSTRDSRVGTMRDVRRICNVRGQKWQLFIFTLETPEGRRIRADRWMRALK